MNESFSFKRFVSLFVRSANRNDKLLRIAILTFVVIQEGWLKSKSIIAPKEWMNIYIFASLFIFNIAFFVTISKQGLSRFLLLPATIFEKFLYAFTSVFVSGIGFAFLVSALFELSSRLLFSVAHQWFAFDFGFCLLMIFTTSLLFFIQFLLMKKLNSMALVIVFTIIILTASIFIDNYFIEHFAQYTPIRLMLYTLLSVAFVGAAYLQFVKCEATFQTKTTVLK